MDKSTREERIPEPRLAVVPDSLLPLPPGCYFTTSHQKYSSSRLIGRGRSLMGSVKDKFSHWTPSVNVVLQARANTFMPLTDAFVIQTCVELDRLSNTRIDVPNVEISISQLAFRAITFDRPVKESSYGWRDRAHDDIVDDDKTLLDVTPASRIIEKHVVVVNQGHKFVYYASYETRIPVSMYWRFMTINNNRAIQLLLNMEARVCGKTFQLQDEMGIEVESGRSAAEKAVLSVIRQ